jgi:hypothetical protein
MSFFPAVVTRSALDYLLGLPALLTGLRAAGDPSAPGSPGTGYKVAMVAMTDKQSTPSSHLSSFLTTVRPAPMCRRRLYVLPKTTSSCGFCNVNGSVVQCHEILHSLRTPNNDGTCSHVSGYQRRTVHMCSLHRKNRCVGWMERLMAGVDLAWDFGYRRHARADSANLALRIRAPVCLRNAPTRAGSSKCRAVYVDYSRA